MKNSFEKIKQKQIDKRYYQPWKIFICFFGIIFLLFIFGPWKYKDINYSNLILYITFFVVASTMAYNVGIKSSIKKALKYNYENKPEKYKVPIRMINAFIIIFFVTSLSMLVISIKNQGIPSGFDIIKNMAIAYSKTQSSKVIGINRPLWIFENFSFFIYSAIILGMYYLKYLNKQIKFLLFLSMGFLVTYFVLFVGQQKEIGDIFIIIISTAYIKFKTNGKRVKLSKKSSFVLFIIFIMLFFSFVLSGRLSISNNTHFGVSKYYYLDTNNFIIRFLPGKFSLGFIYLIYYLSHGFYGLGLCLNQSFIWTKGLGSCTAITILIQRYFGVGVGETIMTYPYRAYLETGWDYLANWHTIFPWLASDLTFFGAVIFLSISAYLYAKCWREILDEQRWQSILIFVILNIQWGFITANNQLFTRKSTLILVVVSVLLWIFRDKKIVFRKHKNYE